MYSAHRQPYVAVALCGRPAGSEPSEPVRGRFPVAVAVSGFGLACPGILQYLGWGRDFVQGL